MCFLSRSGNKFYINIKKFGKALTFLSMKTVKLANKNKYLLF